MLSRFEVVARRRPVALVGAEVDVATVGAPYVALEADLGDEPARLELSSGRDLFAALWDGRGFVLEVTAGGRTTRHRSRRDGKPGAAVDGIALTLTGPHVTVLSRAAGIWTARARHNLTKRVDTRDEEWLAGMHHDGAGVSDLRAGVFGQVGLRDLRAVTHADGTAYGVDGRVLLSATSAGPGFFDTAHTSLWTLDPSTYDLEHVSDLFFRRPGKPGVYGDNATHVVRDGDCWLVATSTWGDFDPRVKGASVGVTLAETTAELTTGVHVLDTRPLSLPTTGFRSVGVWDPHLVHTGEEWLVAYVSATKFFRFHPVLASGPSLDDLSLRGFADRRATEGPTLVTVDGTWVLAASDGRDGRPGERERYPVFDLGDGRSLREIGTLDAAYPTNIPWPTLVQDGEGWLMVGFDATAYGGRLVGYGSHGDVVVQRASR